MSSPSSDADEHGSTSGSVHIPVPFSVANIIKGNENGFAQRIYVAVLQSINNYSKNY